MRKIPAIAALSFVAAWLLGGCAGNGEGLDASGRPLDEAGQGPLVATFDSIQAHVFTPICSVCHAGANAPQGLRLDAANSYNMLVGVASQEVSSLLRVNPGNPGSSYIIQKLEGTAAVGARMPFGGPYLSADTIAVIRQWITNGAQRSAAAGSSSADAAAFQLDTMVPADGDAVTSAPRQIMLGFNHELDATRADATAVRLERVESADAAAGAVAMPAAVSVPAVNPQAVLLTLQQPLAPGRYRIVLSNQAGAGFSDLNGQRLAGAVDGSERVVATFTVEASQ